MIKRSFIHTTAAWLAIMLLNPVVAWSQQTASSSAIYTELERLNSIGSVLYIAAHPDDENTRLIAHLTNHLKLDVSYLSLTRGDGGQNLIGTEIGDGLGLLRSHELLEARRIDGGRQFFTRAVDFGYSKTAEETLKIWDQEAVLSDIVLVIRKVRPDVIITRFSPDENPERSTHGHHTASAKLTLLAFEYAADPNKYPEQLKHFPVHKTQKLYWNTSYWFYGSEEKMNEEVAKNPDKYLQLNANAYLPQLGKTCSDISALSRSQHKSQGFGSSPNLGEQKELLQLLQGEQIGDELLGGIPSTWADLPEAKAIAKKLSQIMSEYDFKAPGNSLAPLFQLRDLLTGLADKSAWTSLCERKLVEANQLIAHCAGLSATAYTVDRKFYAGEDIAINVQAMAFSKEVVVQLKSVRMASLNGPSLEVNSGISSQSYTTKWTGKVPFEMGFSQPYWLQYDKLPGTYQLKNQQLGLAPVTPYPFQMVLDLTVNGNPFVYAVPVMYGNTDPVKGQVNQPLLITPDVMLNLDQEVYIFTGTAPKKVGVDLICSKPGLEGYVELNLPAGWKSVPAFFKTTTGTKGSKQHFEFEVTPPAEQQSVVLRVMFKTDAQVYTVGINEVIYDHVPNTAWFPTSQAELRKISMDKKGQHIAYLMGAGDKVPEALTEMGYQVTLVSPEDIALKPLTYDAVVVGIRAFNTLDNIGTMHAALMKYVEQGGNVIVQYNTSHALKTKDIGPYPLTLSRDRVTEEDAGVVILQPEHAVLNTPNKLDVNDFDHWVQERGLYFPSSWDQNYVPILSMHDAGEPDRQGSLLVAQYGKGYFVYTGLSFFRELPAGVPGAYRLMANLISLGK